MIETEDQRRWWFATHPDYSWGRRGIKGSERAKHDNKVDPKEVDAYVDRALKYETGPVADLLRSVKRNFGTQGEDNTNQSGHSGYTTANRITENPRKTTRSRRYSNEELRRWGIPTPEEEALISDPHTFLDIAPYRRFITAPIQSLKGLLRSTAEGAILYWKKGDYIFDRTTKGNVPVWSTIARRYWKNQSIKEGAIDKWDVENVERMRNGLAPQRTNPRSGELESKELHHQPVPRSQGGGEFIEVWPEEHARIDPHRRLKKR